MTAIGALDILIVDDHEGMRTLLRTMLERAGAAHIRLAANAEAALAALNERPADLILADNMMPGMDGVTLIQRARGDPRLGRAKIIMVTGRAEGRTADEARAAGADAWLVKPVTARALLETIALVLGRA
jgi:two-component system chemotaxis response regulator CheY